MQSDIAKRRIQCYTFKKQRKEPEMPKKSTYTDNEIYAHHSKDFHPDSDEFAIHAHEWHEILYVISGHGSFLVEGAQYTLEAGDIYIMRPGEVHKIITDPKVPYERVVIHFAPSLIKPLDPNLTLLKPFYERPLGQLNKYSPSSDPEGLLRSPFLGFMASKVTNPKLNIAGRLLQFLTVLSGMYGEQDSLPQEQNIHSQLVSYVNEHLFENISVQSIADQFYRSRSQISRIFRQATGSSLWEYVTIKRLLAARAMLQRGESAADACNACGFSEYSSFYRAYRAHFGHSPKEDASR